MVHGIAFQKRKLEERQREDDTKLPCAVPNVLHIFKETQLRCNLRVLGSQLGLSTQDMDGIESKEKKKRRRLEQLLDICSQRGLLDWKHIVNTLKKPALEKHGRKTIEMLSEHCRRGSSASIQSVLPSPISPVSELCPFELSSSFDIPAEDCKFVL